MGSAIGSAVPVIGTAIGGVIGAIIFSLFSSVAFDRGANCLSMEYQKKCEQPTPKAMYRAALKNLGITEENPSS